MKKEKTLDKFLFLKGRSKKSIEKSADSFIELSNKIWAAIFVSLVLIPLVGVLRLMFDSSATLPTLETIINSVKLNLLIFLGIIFFGAIMAIRFRKWALDLYDAIEN